MTQSLTSQEIHDQLKECSQIQLESTLDFIRSIKNPRTFVEDVQKNVEYQHYCISASRDPISTNFYNYQYAARWPASDIHPHEDKARFDRLKPRLQKLVEKLFMFFTPSDGLVCENLDNQRIKAKTFEEAAAIIEQMSNELVHAQTYTNFSLAYWPNQIDRARILNAIDTIPVLRKGADLIHEYSNGGVSRVKSMFANACAEGISFTGKFAIVFIFKGNDDNALPQLVAGNEQISRDEGGHRNYYCAKAKELGISQKDAETIVRRFVDVEIEQTEWILDEPVFSVAEDAIMNLSAKSVGQYVMNLADQVLIRAGCQPIYNVNVNLPWLSGINLHNNTNFYEGDVNNYRLEDIVDKVEAQEDDSLLDFSAEKLGF